MLSYALAIAVAISSLVLFSTAFLMSDIHRQDDFLWSGVGLFYALVLWFCARNITGAVLLGQAAAATLLVSYSWQTLKLRKIVANPEQAPEINNFSLLKATNSLFNRQKIKSQPETISPQIASPEKVTEETIAIPKADKLQNPAQNSIETKSGRFGRFFGKQKKSNINDTKLSEILEAEETTKASKSKENNVAEAPPANIPKSVKSPAPEKKESTQSMEVNESDAKLSVASERSAEPIVKPVEISQPPTDKNIAFPEVTENKPAVDSAGLASPLQAKQKEQSVAEAPEVVSKSSVAPKIQPQITTQVVSDIEDNQIEQENPAELKHESQKVDISANSADKSDPSAQVENPSILDSLETVEVAEVLEALPEDAANSRNQDQENIIEVSTTEIKEINIATEVTKIVQSQEDEDETDSDQEQTSST